MDDTKEFKSALDIARTVCKFIAEGHSSVSRRITSINLGVSASVVTVRIFEKSLDHRNLEEKTQVLYDALVKLGAKKLTVEAFSEGIKYVHHYEKEKCRHFQEEDHIPDGIYFRVDSEGGNLILWNHTLLLESVGHIILPLMDYTPESQFSLNGKKLQLPQ